MKNIPTSIKATGREHLNQDLMAGGGVGGDNSIQGLKEDRRGGQRNVSGLKKQLKEAGEKKQKAWRAADVMRGDIVTGAVQDGRGQEERKKAAGEKR